MSTITRRTMWTKDGYEIILRSAMPEDAETLLYMTKEILGENNFNITTMEEFRFTPDQEMEWLEDVCEMPGHLAIVAEYEMELIGLLNFHLDPRKRMKHNGTLSVNVSRTWRNRGIGRALLQALIAWAQEQSGIEKISLEVFANNERGLALYSSLGFRQEGHLVNQIKMAEGVYVDVYLMGLWLNKPAPPSN